MDLFSSDVSLEWMTKRFPILIFCLIIRFSIYEANPNFTPSLDYNAAYISSFNHPGSIYKGDSSFISTPNPNQKFIPSLSPEYNPTSNYYKTPALYSPMANDDSNR